jgi:ABC-type sugar transport system ATPase subunit
VASVVITNLSKAFPDGKGGGVVAVSEVNLTLAGGEWLTVVGPSGGGKTTLLRLIAGLEFPDAGSIAVDGRELGGVPPHARDVALVFQHHALYPHMTVRENLGFGLRLRRVSAATAECQVNEMAGRLGLRECLDRRPAQLSGGQCQRVALGRALVRRPRVLLLDEPLAHLDAPLRRQLREQLRELHQESGLTVMHVTHDQAEALTTGGRVAVMAGGTLPQVGSASEVYDEPASLVVAQFIGSPPMNLLAGRLRQNRGGLCFVAQAEGVTADAGELLVELSSAQVARLAAKQSRGVVAGIRAERIGVGQPTSGGAVRQTLPASVRWVAAVGGRPWIGIKLGGVQLVAVNASTVRPQVGDQVTVFVEPGGAVFFDPVTGRRLGGPSA